MNPIAQLEISTPFYQEWTGIAGTNVSKPYLQLTVVNEQ